LNQTKEYGTMECERLQRLVKSWYLQVQEESMAPARMVAFMERHIGECAYCLADPLVRQDVEKITAIILPPTKNHKPADEEEESLAAESDEMLPEEDDGTGTEEETEDDETLEDEELGDDELEDDE
jgi:hypothetical protein